METEGNNESVREPVALPEVPSEANTLADLQRYIPQIANKIASISTSFNLTNNPALTSALGALARKIKELKTAIEAPNNGADISQFTDVLNAVRSLQDHLKEKLNEAHSESPSAVVAGHKAGLETAVSQLSLLRRRQQIVVPQTPVSKSVEAPSSTSNRGLGVSTTNSAAERSDIAEESKAGDQSQSVIVSQSEVRRDPAVQRALDGRAAISADTKRMVGEAYLTSLERRRNNRSNNSESPEPLSFERLGEYLAIDVEQIQNSCIALEERIDLYKKQFGVPPKEKVRELKNALEASEDAARRIENLIEGDLANKEQEDFSEDVIKAVGNVRLLALRNLLRVQREFRAAIQADLENSDNFEDRKSILLKQLAMLRERFSTLSSEVKSRLRLPGTPENSGGAPSDASERYTTVDSKWVLAAEKYLNGDNLNDDEVVVLFAFTKVQEGSTRVDYLNEENSDARRRAYVFRSLWRTIANFYEAIERAEVESPSSLVEEAGDTGAGNPQARNQDVNIFLNYDDRGNVVEELAGKVLNEETEITIDLLQELDHPAKKRLLLERIDRTILERVSREKYKLILAGDGSLLVTGAITPEQANRIAGIFDERLLVLDRYRAEVERLLQTEGAPDEMARTQITDRLRIIKQEIKGLEKLIEVAVAPSEYLRSLANDIRAGKRVLETNADKVKFLNGFETPLGRKTLPSIRAALIDKIDNKRQSIMAMVPSNVQPMPKQALDLEKLKRLKQELESISFVQSRIERAYGRVRGALGLVTPQFTEADKQKIFELFSRTSAALQRHELPDSKRDYETARKEFLEAVYAWKGRNADVNDDGSPHEYEYYEVDNKGNTRKDASGAKIQIGDKTHRGPAVAIEGIKKRFEAARQQYEVAKLRDPNTPKPDGYDDLERQYLSARQRYLSALENVMAARREYIAVANKPEMYDKYDFRSQETGAFPIRGARAESGVKLAAIRQLVLEPAWQLTKAKEVASGDKNRADLARVERVMAFVKRNKKLVLAAGGLALIGMTALSLGSGMALGTILFKFGSGITGGIIGRYTLPTALILMFKRRYKYLEGFSEAQEEVSKGLTTAAFKAAVGVKRKAVGSDYFAKDVLRRSKGLRLEELEKVAMSLSAEAARRDRTRERRKVYGKLVGGIVGGVTGASMGGGVFGAESSATAPTGGSPSAVAPGGAIASADSAAVLGGGGEQAPAIVTTPPASPSGLTAGVAPETPTAAISLEGPPNTLAPAEVTVPAPVPQAPGGVPVGAPPTEAPPAVATAPVSVPGGDAPGVTPESLTATPESFPSTPHTVTKGDTLIGILKSELSETLLKNLSLSEQNRVLMELRAAVNESADLQATAHITSGNADLLYAGKEIDIGPLAQKVSEIIAGDVKVDVAPRDYAFERGDNFWDLAEGQTDAGELHTMSQIDDANTQKLIQLTYLELLKNEAVRAATGFTMSDLNVIPEGHVVHVNALDELLFKVAREHNLLLDGATPPVTGSPTGTTGSPAEAISNTGTTPSEETSWLRETTDRLANSWEKITTIRDYARLYGFSLPTQPEMTEALAIMTKEELTVEQFINRERLYAVVEFGTDDSLLAETTLRKINDVPLQELAVFGADGRFDYYGTRINVETLLRSKGVDVTNMANTNLGNITNLVEVLSVPGAEHSATVGDAIQKVVKNGSLLFANETTSQPGDDFVRQAVRVQLSGMAPKDVSFVTRLK